jgi:hypothetical protein
MNTAEQLMQYMHASLSSSATDSRGDIDNADAAELVNALVHRYRNLGRGPEYRRRHANSAMTSDRAGDESDWLLIENDTI